jgi:GH35 family endo-1,4-beta-xylanase
MTEFDIAVDKQNEMVPIMDEVLRLALSHPKMEGIIFWGFWDQAMWRKQSALVSGSRFSVCKTLQKF